jgi:hypothetical protein
MLQPLALGLTQRVVPDEDIRQHGSTCVHTFFSMAALAQTIQHSPTDVCIYVLVLSWRLNSIKFCGYALPSKLGSTCTNKTTLFNTCIHFLQY